MEKWVETGGEIWNCIIIGDDYDFRLSSFERLTEEVKKDFPWLTGDDVFCVKVVNSIRRKGCPAISFQISSDTGSIPDSWHSSDIVDELRM